MSVYYMLLDADLFSDRISPALAVSWRQRNFAACRALCTELVPAAHAFAERFHLGPEEPLLCKVARDLPFDRNYWQLLVGELLLYAAVEVPEIPLAPETLACLLAPKDGRRTGAARSQWAAIDQAHFGQRELCFGLRCYRPEWAGYNNREDVARLRDYLARQTPEQWTVADLAELPEGTDAEEQKEELEFAREAFAALRELYQRAATYGQLVVCEVL